jgi:ComF family protein
MGHLRRVVHALARLGLAVLFPPSCWWCRGPNPLDRGHLCLSCQRRGVLPLPRHRCRSCAAPLPPASGGCPDCGGGPVPFESVVAPGRYAGLLGEMIRALKFRGRWYLARPLGELMATAVRESMTELPSLVVPVPLARLRQMRRGYNQAELLAREVARQLRRPCAPGALRRRGWRAIPQTRLPRHRRARNVRGVYRARRSRVQGHRVLLVDDVVTTTSTVRAAAAALGAAGASQVLVVAAARASRTTRPRHPPA